MPSSRYTAQVSYAAPSRLRLQNRAARVGRSSAIAALFCACLAAQTQPPPAQPAKQQTRDLRIEKIEPESVPPKRASIPRSWAVIIGISRYQKLPESKQLQYPERDAQSIHTILISPEGGAFKAENVHILAGSKATLAAIRQEIGTWLPAHAQDGDRVLIYFAGHGYIDRGKGYLAPYDLDPNNVSGTGYPMDELGATIGGKINAKWKILLTDSCHAGMISPEDTANLNRSLLDLNKSLFSLTASRDREQSLESPELEGGHGVFTYYLVKGLQGEADYSHDGIVSADELAEYVRSQVREATRARQNPTSDRGSFDPNMLLAYLPANAPPANAPAPKFGGLIFEAPNTEGVEVFVDGTSVGVIDKDHKNIQVPGLKPGEHTVKAVKMGFEPDGPRQEMVYPGTDSTVTIRIQIPARRKKAAVDALDKGIESYQKGKGNEQSYRKAVDFFLKALSIEPNYSQAAFYLGLTYNALFDEEKAQAYYKKAIDIDPDYWDAHANYGGMLLDIGDTDQALREFDRVLTRAPNHVVALTLQAQAFRLKGLYPDAIESARKAIQLAPKNAEPHLWLGDALRLSGKYPESRGEYEQYLRLSDFDSKLAGKLNYYVLGSLIGMGKKKRSAQHDIWSELRSLAYFGLCDSERKLSLYDQAIEHCQRSLSYYPEDAYAHFALATAYMQRAINDNAEAELDPAERHFKQVIAINPYLAEAGYAKKNLAQIQAAYPNR